MVEGWIYIFFISVWGKNIYVYTPLFCFWFCSEIVDFVDEKTDANSGKEPEPEPKPVVNIDETVTASSPTR